MWVDAHLPPTAPRVSAADDAVCSIASLNQEHDAPEALLSDSQSLFSKLVDDTGSAAEHLRTLAKEGAAARGAAK